MSSHITASAQVSREQARQSDGKFGTQAHDRATSVDLAADMAADPGRTVAIIEDSARSTAVKNIRTMARAVEKVQPTDAGGPGRRHTAVRIAGEIYRELALDELAEAVDNLKGYGRDAGADYLVLYESDDYPEQVSGYPAYYQADGTEIYVPESEDSDLFTCDLEVAYEMPDDLDLDSEEAQELPFHDSTCVYIYRLNGDGHAPGHDAA